MNLVNVEIRSHLVPFFFQEMDGVIAQYEGQTVKMITLLPSSSLANYIYSQIGYQREHNGGPYERYLLYLSIKKTTQFTLSGQIYSDRNCVKSELKMEIEQVREINNLLEDIFRTSFVYFIEGCKSGKLSICKAIELFMTKYSLFEYGYEISSMRKMYYEQTKNETLYRFQQRSSNRVIGFV